jgi:hypothetical protein
MKQVTVCVEAIKIVNRVPHPVVKVIKEEKEPVYLDLFIRNIFSDGYIHDDKKGTVTYYSANSIKSVEVKEVKDKDGE